MTVILTTSGRSLFNNTGRNCAKQPTDEEMKEYLLKDPAKASAE